MRIGKQDQGKTIEVRSGTEVTLELNENPTTGYAWQIRDLDPKLATVAGSEYASESKAIGAGGLRMFKIKVTGKGKTPLRAKLLRSWEGDRSTVERFEITLEVK
jgi:inhibitor of cysteine peptidase